MWRYNIKKIPNLKRNFSENVNKIIVIKKKKFVTLRLRPNNN